MSRTGCVRGGVWEWGRERGMMGRGRASVKLGLDLNELVSE